MTNARTTTKMTPMQRIAQQAALTAATTTSRKAKTPKACAGGCGLMTKGGDWFPGHDGRIQGRMIGMIRAGATQAEAMTNAHCNDDWDLEAMMAAIEATRTQAEEAVA